VSRGHTKSLLRETPLTECLNPDVEVTDVTRRLKDAFVTAERRKRRRRKRIFLAGIPTIRRQMENVSDAESR